MEILLLLLSCADKFLLVEKRKYSGFHLDRIQMNLTPFPSPYYRHGVASRRVGEGCPQDGVRFPRVLDSTEKRYIISCGRTKLNTPLFLLPCSPLRVPRSLSLRVIQESNRIAILRTSPRLKPPLSLIRRGEGVR